MDGGRNGTPVGCAETVSAMPMDVKVVLSLVEDMEGWNCGVVDMVPEKLRNGRELARAEISRLPLPVVTCSSEVPGTTDCGQPTSH